MIVFYTPATYHLKHLLPMFKVGSYISKQFSDGEWYVKIEDDVLHKDVWVIAATNPPADHLIQLLLVLNALQLAGAHIHLFFTYFGYARQDCPLPGEASSLQVMGTIFTVFPITKIIVLHPHSMLLQDFLSCEIIFPYDAICSIAQEYDAIAAPDQGAYAFVTRIASQCDKEAIYLTKIRPEQETVKILEYDGTVSAKRILIVDDMIATGRTIVEVSKRLKQLGATQISVWATHGIFSGDARHIIEKNGFEKLYVTNSLPQKNHSSKIEIISIAPLIEQVIKQN